MSFSKVHLHYVWATKNRQPILVDPYRDLLFKHIKDYSVKNEIFIENINGYHDHVHCAISLGVNQTIQKVVQLLKGESAHWFNHQSGFGQKKLTWQGDYYCVSVSESQMPKLKAYIDGQILHHQKHSFDEEIDRFTRLFGFKILVG